MSESDVPTRCAPYEEDLSAWLDEELTEAEADGVRAHVEGCPRCTARVQELRAVDESLRVLASATPGAPEAARLERLRARIAAEQAQLQPLPARAVEPGESSAPASAHAASVRSPARAPRRRLPAALVAAAAAAALAVVVLPRLREHAPATNEGELAAQKLEAPVRAAERIAPAPAPAPVPPIAQVPPEARLAARQVARTPGQLGSSAPPVGGAAAASADASAPALAAANGTTGEEELDLALALDQLEGVAPEDLAVVERLDALERMAEP